MSYTTSRNGAAYFFIVWMVAGCAPKAAALERDLSKFISSPATLAPVDIKI